MLVGVADDSPGVLVASGNDALLLRDTARSAGSADCVGDVVEATAGPALSQRFGTVRGPLRYVRQ